MKEGKFQALPVEKILPYIRARVKERIQKEFRKNSERIQKEFRKNSERIQKEFSTVV